MRSIQNTVPYAIEAQVGGFVQFQIRNLNDFHVTRNEIHLILFTK